MKKIALKKVKIDYDDDAGLTPDNAPEFMDYRKTIMGLLKTPKNPEKGADFEETAQAMPIWAKFRKLGATVTWLPVAASRSAVKTVHPEPP